MKKTVVLLSVLTALASCNITTSQEDTQILQTKYQTVYKIDDWNYVTFDSISVYHVTVKADGQVKATIKIK
jgi:hypothetical protein